jgi:serine/threonine protein kinase
MDAASWDRAKDLVADLLELPSEERDAFLVAHCSDPALLAEIRALIKGYEAAPDFLERPAVDRPAPEPIDDEGLEPGTQVGPYVIVDRIGRGGMGQVFLGNDRRLQRKVALKGLLSSSHGAEHERTRILREARAAARITHPNVAAIHDVVEHNTQIYIVMEYVEGESLAARMRRERLPLKTVLTIGRQLASALGAAHAKGIVHRDLKPMNVQLTLDGTVKVLDFGVAKSTTPMVTLSTGSRGSARALEAQGVPGTPEYMSPEQLQGHDVDERSDIFSLGVMLFEMATGRRPFADIPFVERLAAPNTAAPNADAIDHTLPRRVADVIGLALKADRRERIQSAHELEARLGELLHELEPDATTASRPRQQDVVVSLRLQRWVLRAALTCAALVLTLFACGWLTGAALNLTLQRPARFAPESLFTTVVIGIRANFMLIPTAVFLAILGFSGLYLFRLVCLIKPIERGRQLAAPRCIRAIRALGLDKPGVLAQVVAALALFAIIAIARQSAPLLEAMSRNLSTAPPEALLPLAPDNLSAFREFRTSVNLLLWLVGGSLLFIYRLRRRNRSRDSVIPYALATAILGFVLLAHWLPYRIMYQNEFERVDYAGARCYLLGQSGTDAIVYCPEMEPPKNRRISLSSPELRRLGAFESIFTPSFHVPIPDGASTPRTSTR